MQSGVLRSELVEPAASRASDFEGRIRPGILDGPDVGGLDLSRLEAACLPENAASRGLLEKSGFKYEGVAQSYLQIAGRWRNQNKVECGIHQPGEEPFL